MRLNAEHHQLILTFSEEHAGIITNSWSSGLGEHQNSKRLWELLANKLNSLGYGILSIAEYKRRITDWKSKTKAKAANVKNDVTGTGGGPANEIHLSEHEKRLLALMGKISYQGDDVKELGVFPSTSSQSLSTSFQLATPLISQKSNSSSTAPPQTLFPRVTALNSKSILVSAKNCYPLESVSSNSSYSFLSESLNQGISSQKSMQQERMEDINNGNLLAASNYQEKPVPDSLEDSATTPKNRGKKRIKTSESRSTQDRKKVKQLSQDIKTMNDETLNILKGINCNLTNINENFTLLNVNLQQLTEAVLMKNRNFNLM